MPTRSRGRVKPAPIWRRLVAWLINALVTIGGGGSTVMVAGLMPEGLTERVSAALPERPPHLLSSLEPTFAILRRNGMGLGFRAMGLRRADARTGGRVTVRSALIDHVFSALTRTLTRELLRPTQTAGLDRMKVFQKQAQEIEHQFPDDSR